MTDIKPNWKSLVVRGRVQPFPSTLKLAVGIFHRVAGRSASGTAKPLAVLDKNNMIVGRIGWGGIVECAPEALPVKAPKFASDAAFKILSEAHAGIRAKYIEAYTNVKLSILNKVRADFAAVGMDLETYAPYPSSNIGRSAYKQAIAKRATAQKYFELDAVKHPHGTYRHNEPCYYVEKPGNEAKLKTEAREEANALVDSYLHKMAGKIGKQIKSAKCNDRVWDDATLDVVCEDGEAQQWKTQCILNRSVYHVIFNQWPSRRVA